jgi:hypothetical protein
MTTPRDKFESGPLTIEQLTQAYKELTDGYEYRWDGNILCKLCGAERKPAFPVIAYFEGRPITMFDGYECEACKR